jgi:hypothetical protein
MHEHRTTLSGGEIVIKLTVACYELHHFLKNVDIRLEWVKEEQIRFIDLWRWYVNITITILDITHSHVLYLKYNVSVTGDSVSVQWKPPVAETSTIYCVDLSKYHLKTGTECYIRNAVF